MPTYSFFCKERHETEWFGSHSNRPESMRCLTDGCANKAKYAPSIMKLTVRKHYNQKALGLALHDFKCDDCGHVFDKIVDRAEKERVSDGATCPKCDGNSPWLPAAPGIDRDSERYPRFDRGLGMIVNSKQHLRDICKNPRAFGINSDELTPVEGDWDEDEYMNNAQREDKKLEDGYNEYVDQLENAPAFKDFRKARDEGRV